MQYTLSTSLVGVNLQHGAYNPINGFVYITNVSGSNHLIYIYNGTTNVATLDAGTTSYGAGISFQPGSSVTSGWVAVVTNGIYSITSGGIGSVALSGTNPETVGVASNGNVFVGTGSTNNLLSYNPNTATTTTISLSGTSSQDYTAILPVGNLVYVANGNTPNVFIIDATANTQVGNISVSSPPTDLTTNGIYVYVACGSANLINVITSSTNTGITYSVVNPQRIAYNASTNELFVSNANNVISFISLGIPIVQIPTAVKNTQVLVTVPASTSNGTIYSYSITGTTIPNTAQLYSVEQIANLVSTSVGITTNPVVKVTSYSIFAGTLIINIIIVTSGYTSTFSFTNANFVFSVYYL
jgi:DNA-binding beta-propeller fold protein YncE